MKIVIAGTRLCTDCTVVEEAICTSPWAGKITCIVEGGAMGVDRLARLWARQHGIPVVTVEANWKQFGRAAGPRRNRAMVRNYGAVGVILVWTATSRGSLSLLSEARRAGLPIFEHLLSTTGARSGATPPSSARTPRAR